MGATHTCERFASPHFVPSFAAIAHRCTSSGPRAEIIGVYPPRTQLFRSPATFAKETAPLYLANDIEPHTVPLAHARSPQTQKWDNSVAHKISRPNSTQPTDTTQNMSCIVSTPRVSSCKAVSNPHRRATSHRNFSGALASSIAADKTTRSTKATLETYTNAVYLQHTGLARSKPTNLLECPALANQVHPLVNPTPPSKCETWPTSQCHSRRPIE